MGNFLEEGILPWPVKDLLELSRPGTFANI